MTDDDKVYLHMLGKASEIDGPWVRRIRWMVLIALPLFTALHWLPLFLK